MNRRFLILHMRRHKKAGYMWTVLVLSSCFIVSLAMSERMTDNLVINALEQAVLQCEPQFIIQIEIVNTRALSFKTC